MEIEIVDRYVWMQDVTVRIVLYSGTTDYGGLRVYCRFWVEMGGDIRDTWDTCNIENACIHTRH